jgi:hypothetical protein
MARATLFEGNSPMEYVEYPKALYLRGWDDLAAMVTVHSERDEAAARAEGYKSLAGEAEEDAATDAPKRRGRPLGARAE